LWCTVIATNNFGSKTTKDLEIFFKKSIHYKNITDDHVLVKKNFQNATTINTNNTIETNNNSNNKTKKIDRLHSTTSYTQLKMLFRRTWLSYIRDVDQLYAKLFKSITLGVVMGIVFYNQGNPSSPLLANGIPEAKTLSVISIIFWVTSLVCVMNIESMPLLCSLNPLFKRELNAFAYSVAPYWLSQCLTNIPFIVFFHYVLLIIVYFMVGFPFTLAYFVYFTVNILLANIGNFFLVLCFAAFIKEEKAAFALYPLAFLFMVTFSGYCITLDSLPVAWSWAPYLSLTRWSFEGLMVNQWESFDTDDATIENNNGDVLSLYSFENVDKTFCLFIMLRIN
jgi:hypothetical protein